LKFSKEDDPEKIKEYIGELYIQLRGICKINEVWFEEAVGKAFNKLQNEEGVGED